MVRKGRINIREWIKPLANLGVLNKQQFLEIASANDDKEQFLRKYHLPQYRYFGTVKSVPALFRIIEPQARNGRFWLRCIPAKTKVKVMTCIDMGFHNLQEQITLMNNSGEVYLFQIIEYIKGTHAGTIIADHGKIIGELWCGDHIDQDRIFRDESFRQTINIPIGETAFMYSKNATARERSIMIDALKFFAKTLHPKDLEQLKLYADYVYNPDWGYIFIDGSEKDLWTNTGL